MQALDLLSDLNQNKVAENIARDSQFEILKNHADVFLNQIRMYERTIFVNFKNTPFATTDNPICIFSRENHFYKRKGIHLLQHMRMNPNRIILVPLSSVIMLRYDCPLYNENRLIGNKYLGETNIIVNKVSASELNQILIRDQSRQIYSSSSMELRGHDFLFPVGRIN